MPRKDPAFLFYAQDFESGTKFFTDEQVGKYIRLICAQHSHGHLSEKQMLHICQSYDKDIFDKFEKDADGLYFNGRLEAEIIKRKNYSESRSKNRTKNQNTSFTYDSHMENVNANDCINVLNSKKNGKTFVNPKTQGQELFADRISRHSKKDTNGAENY